MLYYALMFLVVGLIAGALGLFGIAAIAGQIAWVLFLIGVIFIVVHLISGRRALPRRQKISAGTLRLTHEEVLKGNNRTCDGSGQSTTQEDVEHEVDVTDDRRLRFTNSFIVWHTTGVDSHSGVCWASVCSKLGTAAVTGAPARARRSTTRESSIAPRLGGCTAGRLRVNET